MRASEYPGMHKVRGLHTTLGFPFRLATSISEEWWCHLLGTEDIGTRWAPEAWLPWWAQASPAPALLYSPAWPQHPQKLLHWPLSL